jgi:DNA-binding FadR family transcriptional regulator
MGNWEAHRAVGEAIATRDPDAARAAMERLLEFTRTRLAGQGTGAAAQEEERRRQS